MVFCLLALWAAWSALGQSGGMNDFRDSHLVHPYEDAAVTTVTRYGQVPLWTPWTCGGLSLQGNRRGFLCFRWFLPEKVPDPIRTKVIKVSEIAAISG